MIRYRSRLLKRGEVWFDNEPDFSSRVDTITYYQRSQPVPGTKWREFYTFAIDLTSSEEELSSRLGRDTLYKIRRARERDKVTCVCLDPNDVAVMDRFETMYNQFANMKGLPRLYRERMEGFAAAGVLDLSAARDIQGNVLVYHANYRDGTRARGVELPSLYRASADSGVRNFVGRANRYLIWNGILRYKEQGLRWFDFGGWYHGTDPAMLKINDFKRGFGGVVQRGYECEQVLTLKGRLVTLAGEFLQRYRRLPIVSGPEAMEQDSQAVSSQDESPSPAPLPR